MVECGAVLLAALFVGIVVLAVVNYWDSPFILDLLKGRL